MTTPTDLSASRMPGAPKSESSRKGLWFWLYWLGPPIFLAAGVYAMGTDYASADHTRSLIRDVLNWLSAGSGDHLTKAQLYHLNFLFRKSGHFFSYALFGLLWLRAGRGIFGSISLKLALAACGMAAFWAAIDEYHQSFSHLRTSSVEDVLLDTAGALLGIVAYGIYCRWKQQRIQTS